MEDMVSDEAQGWLVAGIVVLVMAVGLLLAAQTEASAADCVDEVSGEPGLSHPVDGCVTVAEYDAMFSEEALEATPSLSPEFETVADAARANGVDLSVAASERPRYFMGERLLSFREVVGQVAL